MAGTDIKATSHKVFPEMIWRTNGQNLAQGDSNLFKIDAIPPNQVIVPLLYSVESVASINSQLFLDNVPITNEIPNDALGGITKGTSSHPEHEIGYAFKEFRYGINNGSGGASNDHRSRIHYLVDARYTSRRIVQYITNLGKFKMHEDEGRELPEKCPACSSRNRKFGKCPACRARTPEIDMSMISDPTNLAEQIRSQNKEVLSKRDIEAISILWKERKINVLERILNGSNVPPLWGDFLKIHEVIGTQQNAIKKTLTASYSDTSIIDFDVPEGKVATLEGLKHDVDAQATVGEKTISISRDDDKDYIEYDPACMEGSQIHTAWHIHAFDNINVRIKDTALTANSKYWAGLTIRTPGAAFKAKMQEFSPGALPSSLEPTESEERLIDELRLRELARVGIVAIG